jgi:acyl-CoA thioester hydrolase
MRTAGLFTAEIEFDVAFHDVDMVGVVWHGHYLRYLENARWALMHRLEYGLKAMIDSGHAWPIVDVQMKYVRPARFGDRLRARAALVEYEHRINVNYLVTLAATGQRVLRASTTQVAVDAQTGVLQFDCPPAFVDHVRAVLARVRA